jgi:hypothetical protein
LPDATDCTSSVGASLRRCSSCAEWKPATLEHFYKHPAGFTSKCKPCHNAYAREWRLSHPERSRELEKNWRDKNRDANAERYRKWADANRDHVNAKRREAHKNNPERFKAQRRRRHANIVQNVANRMRCAIRRVLVDAREPKGGRSWESLVGYTVRDLVAHIERQFVKGMSWDNFGAWHVDHILPIASFSFQSVDDPEFRACWALTNLRPLWADANRRKHAKRLTLL